MTLFRNILSVGAATALSRVLGFVRDTLIASTLGTGAVADAFVVAFRLPNLFRRLFAEGSLNTAFVPLYLRLDAADPGRAGAGRRFAAEAFSVLLLLQLVLAALAMIAAPLLVQVLAPGFAGDAAKFELTVVLTRVCFPYLACLSLTALIGGVLNAHRRFFLVALAPVLLNVVLIGFLAVIAGSNQARTPAAGLTLSIGVAVAGLVQFSAVAVAAWRMGLGWRPRWPRLTPEVRRLIRLGLPGMVGGGITQINIVVGTIIASLQAGAVSYLYYADRIYQLPLGIVGIAIGVVLLPEVTRHVHAGRDDLAFQSLNRSFELAALLTIPAAVALVVSGTPIVAVLFERGAFGPEDTERTAAALTAFGFGLPAFVFTKVLLSAFFAREDTRTPMWIGLVSVALNIGLSLALFASLRHVGIALATSIAAWAGAALLWRILVHRGHWRTDGELEHRLPRIIAAAAVMGAALAGLNQLMANWLGAENPLALKAGALAILVGVGLALFFGLAQWLGAVDLAALVGRARAREERAIEPGAGFD